MTMIYLFAYAGNMGYHNDNARTPHFDREAAAGVKLERHYTFR